MASAATPTACGLVSAAEYKKVLGHAVTMTPGEGTHSCNVFIGRVPVSAKTWIIPNLSPYNAAYGKYIKGMYARAAKSGGSFRKVPALGPMGAVLEFHAPHPSVTSYFQKGSWFVAFQGEWHDEGAGARARVAGLPPPLRARSRPRPRDLDGPRARIEPTGLRAETRQS